MKAPGNLPVPRADETMYSIFRRMLWDNGLRPPAVLQMLGCSLRGVYRPISSSVQKVCAMFSDVAGEKPDDFVHRHSSLPLFRPFLPPTMYQRACEKLINEADPHLDRLLSFVATRLQSLLLRFCPKCAEAEKKCFGHTYWHRVHQLQGVEFCPEHGIELLSNCPECGHELGLPNDWPIPKTGCPACGCDFVVRAIKAPADSRMLRFSRFMSAALSGHIPTHDFSSQQSLLFDRAILAFGLQTPVCVAARLRREVERHFGSALLAEMCLDTRSGPSARWIELLLAGKAHTHDPRAHMLLTSVLYSEVSDYLSELSDKEKQATRESPLGDYPRPSNVRVGLTSSHIRSIVRGRSLVAAVTDGSINPHTVRKRMRLTPHLEQARAQGQKHLTRLNDRKVILEARRIHPNVCRTWFKNSHVSTSIKRLALCDSNWLDKHVPLQRKGAYDRFSKVDIASLDLVLSKIIRSVTIAQREGTVKPTYLSRKNLLRRHCSGYGGLSRRGLLPLTEREIINGRESYRHFRFRLRTWIAAKGKVTARKNMRAMSSKSRERSPSNNEIPVQTPGGQR